MLERSRGNRKKKGHLRSPLQREKLLAPHRPAPGSEAGAVLSFGYRMGTPLLQSVNFNGSPLWISSKTKQEYHSGLHHQSPPSGIHTPTKQGQKSHDREAVWTGCCPQCQRQKTGKRHTLALFSRNNGKSPATDLQEKNGSFRKHVCLLLSYYFYTTTQTDLILTHQTVGNRPSSQASPSARETQALRSQAAKLPRLKSPERLVLTAFTISSQLSRHYFATIILQEYQEQFRF